MYEAAREPHPDWGSELAALAPLREHAAHLTIRWHAGTPDAPTGRWVIYECAPHDVAVAFGLDQQLLAALEEYPDDTLLRWTHDYWVRTRTMPSPVWVVQGREGGHPFKYTSAETVFAEIGLLPAEIPAIGALPYAEPDRRTWLALHKRATINRQYPNALAARTALKAIAAEARRRHQVAAAAAAVEETVKDGLADLLDTAVVPVTREDAKGTTADLSDEHLARYIETGKLTLTP